MANKRLKYERTLNKHKMNGWNNMFVIRIIHVYYRILLFSLTDHSDLLVRRFVVDNRWMAKS